MSLNKYNCVCGSVVNVSSKNRHFKSKKHIQYEEEQKNKKPKDEQRSKNKKIYKQLKKFYFWFLRSHKVFCETKAFNIKPEDQEEVINIFEKYQDKKDDKYIQIIKKFIEKFKPIYKEYLKLDFEKETPDLEYDFYLLNLEIGTVIEEARQKLKNKINFNIMDLINNSEKILYASESPKFFKNLEEERERKKGKGTISFKELQKTDPKKAEELWNSILPQIETLIKMNNINLK